jgi:hypothetical protein
MSSKCNWINLAQGKARLISSQIFGHYIWTEDGMWGDLAADGRSILK